MSAKIKEAYFRLSAVLLLATGVVKVVSAFSDSRLLQQLNPIFGISNGWVFAFIGTIEIYIASAVAFSRNSLLRTSLLALLVTGFLAYRSALVVLHIPGPCKCLGAATEWIPVLAVYETPLMNATLGFLALSYGFLLMAALRPRKPKPSVST